MMQKCSGSSEAELLVHCLKEVTRRARHGSNSTSPLTNQMAQYTAAAYVELAEALQWEPTVRRASLTPEDNDRRKALGLKVRE